jgi:hypothetical protein
LTTVFYHGWTQMDTDKRRRSGGKGVELKALFRHSRVLGITLVSPDPY